MPKTAYSVSIGANSLFGGVNGGWLDSNNVGWGGFYATQPRTVNLRVQFANSFGEMGAGIPNVQIYYQNQGGAWDVYWPSSKNEDSDFVEPTMPTLLPEPAILPPDPSELGKTTLEGIDSNKDGVRDDVQRYITLTYPAPEDKPLRAALREYSALQQQFIANADYSKTAVQCILHFRPNDTEDLLFDVDNELFNTNEPFHDPISLLFRLHLPTR